MITSTSLAQKNELKAAEKAIKSGSYAQAKSSVMAAEALLPNMDDKMKDKFYFLKAQALYAGGQVTGDDVDAALKAVDDLEALKESTGKSKYLQDALPIRTKILESVVQAAFKASQDNQNAIAGDRFYKAYILSPQDTLYLYAAASSYLNAQQYDKSLEFYKKLQELDYTGESYQYVAINKETNKEEVFNDKSLRDLSVKSGQYIVPKDKKLPSKKGEILRFMALIYSNQDNTDKALELIADAKKFNPDDTQLVIAEAKAYLASDQKDKIKPLLNSASALIEGDAINLMNFGIFAMEIGEDEMAANYFKSSSELDPNMAEPYLNRGALILNKDKAIVDEMNSLGNSAADNARYDELRGKRTELYKEAIPFIEKAFELKPDISTGKYLRDLYSAAFMTDKFNEMKQKIADMEAGN